MIASVLATVLTLATGPDQDGPDTPDTDDSTTHLRVGVDAGGGYTTNVYGNASQLDDLLAIAAVAGDLELSPNPTTLLTLTYRGELEWLRLESGQRHYGQLANLGFGWRPGETIYLTLDGGAEHAYFVDRPLYNFWGAFGRTGARWELGESTTLRVAYGFRADQFPDYDLDNLSHTGEASWEMALGDQWELSLPLTFAYTAYRERFLLNAAGEATGTPRSALFGRGEPRLIFFPNFDVELSAAAFGELNQSNDTYFYAGPFGSTDPSVDPALIRHFDSFIAVGGRLAGRWLIADRLTLGGEVALGTRRFADRPAFNNEGLPTDALEVDVFSSGLVELEWRIAGLRLAASYGLLRQWSNDAMWDYAAHRVVATIGGFWAND